MTNKNNKIWYILIGVIIVVLLVVILIIQIQNSQKNAELERQMKEAADEKQFCDNLKINIEKTPTAQETGLGVGDVGVNYCLSSNENTEATSIITLENGKQVQEDKTLQAGSCMMQQISFIMGYQGSGYNNDVVCKDIQSIELISKRCPLVKSIVTDTSKLTCGI